MNTVDENNFNWTMDGYVKYALNSMEKDLIEEGYTEKQIDEIIKSFKNGLRWAKDEMTMEEARRY